MAAAATVVSCSSDESGSRPGDAPEREGSVGSVGLSLTSAGVTIDSFNYVITGAGGFSRSGQVDVTRWTR